MTRTALFSDTMHRQAQLGPLRDHCYENDTGALLIDLDSYRRHYGSLPQPAVMSHYLGHLADTAENLRKQDIVVCENKITRPIKDVVFSQHDAGNLLKQLDKRHGQHHVFVFFGLAGIVYGSLESQPLVDKRTDEQVPIILVNTTKLYPVNGLMLMARVEDLPLRHGNERRTIPLNRVLQSVSHLSRAIKKGFLKAPKKRRIRQPRIDDWDIGRQQPRFI